MLLAARTMLFVGGTAIDGEGSEGSDGSDWSVGNDDDNGGGKCSEETNETMFFAMRFCTFFACRPNRREDRVSLELDPSGDALTMSTWSIGSRRVWQFVIVCEFVSL